MDQEFNLPVKSNGLVEIEKSRAVQEVQAAIIIAKKFPRDQTSAFNKVDTACQRLSLAEKAMYSYPRGKDKAGKALMVTGPSIRLAEVLAQNWGNIDFGVRELERRTLPDGTGVSVAESFCWDMETNVRQTKTFEVPHLRESTAKGSVKLTDSRDIYELVANMGSRRTRACILGILPIDYVETAVVRCKETVKKGGGALLIDRIKKVVIGFKELVVTQEMLENYLGHPISETNEEELVDLISIGSSIRDGQQSREDFFLVIRGEVKTKTVTDIVEKEAAQNKPAKKTEEPKETIPEEVVDAALAEAREERAEVVGTFIEPEKPLPTTMPLPPQPQDGDDLNKLTIQRLRAKVWEEAKSIGWDLAVFKKHCENFHNTTPDKLDRPQFITSIKAIQVIKMGQKK